jgi:hypothetical protein
MKSLIRLMFLILLLVGWGLAAGALHVIRTPSSLGTISIVPKNALGIEDTYVDTRNWTLEEVSGHPILVMRLIELGQSNLLAHVAPSESRQHLEIQLIDAVSRSRPEPRWNATRALVAAARLE